MAPNGHVTGAPAVAGPPAMSLRGLTKRYGARTAVDGLTIEAAFILANLAVITGGLGVFVAIWRRRHG